MPTRDAPESGCIAVGGVDLWPARRWIEDGIYVVESREFDVFGEGEDWAQAFQDFINHADDLLSYYAELAGSAESADGLTEGEAPQALELGRRLVKNHELVNELLKKQNRKLENLDRVLHLDLRGRLTRQRGSWRASMKPNSARMSRV